MFYLDLEQTVIDCWADCNLITPQVERIRNYLNANGATEVHIFSFAIWDEKDKKEFVARGMNVMLEKALDLPVMTWPSVHEMMLADKEMTRTYYDSITDFVSMRGKTDGFRNYLLGRNINFKKAVLIDDVVPNQILSDRNGWSIEWINVDSLD